MKLKTHKATVKKVRVTKAGKFMTMRSGQDHFNARESGVIKRNKRRLMPVNATDAKNLRHLLPYS